MADNNVRQNTPATPNTVNEQSKSNPTSSNQANNPANNPVNGPADSASTSSAVEPEQIRPRLSLIHI